MFRLANIANRPSTTTERPVATTTLANFLNQIQYGVQCKRLGFGGFDSTIPTIAPNQTLTQLDATGVRGEVVDHEILASRGDLFAEIHMLISIGVGFDFRGCVTSVNEPESIRNECNQNIVHAVLRLLQNSTEPVSIGRFPGMQKVWIANKKICIMDRQGLTAVLADKIPHDTSLESITELVQKFYTENMMGGYLVNSAYQAKLQALLNQHTQPAANQVSETQLPTLIAGRWGQEATSQPTEAGRASPDGVLEEINQLQRDLSQAKLGRDNELANFTTCTPANFGHLVLENPTRVRKLQQILGTKYNIPGLVSRYIEFKKATVKGVQTDNQPNTTTDPAEIKAAFSRTFDALTQRSRDHHLYFALQANGIALPQLNSGATNRTNIEQGFENEYSLQTIEQLATWIEKEVVNMGTIYEYQSVKMIFEWKADTQGKNILAVQIRDKYFLDRETKLQVEISSLEDSSDRLKLAKIIALQLFRGRLLKLSELEKATALSAGENYTPRNPTPASGELQATSSSKPTTYLHGIEVLESSPQQALQKLYENNSITLKQTIYNRDKTLYRSLNLDNIPNLKLDKESVVAIPLKDSRGVDISYQVVDTYSSESTPKVDDQGKPIYYDFDKMSVGCMCMTEGGILYKPTDNMVFVLPKMMFEALETSQGRRYDPTSKSHNLNLNNGHRPCSSTGTPLFRTAPKFKLVSGGKTIYEQD